MGAFRETKFHMDVRDIKIIIDIYSSSKVSLKQNFPDNN